MTDRITAEEFLGSPGVEDWTVEGDKARASFRTRVFDVGVTLINRIGILADGANHHPDVDLRYASVTVYLTTHDAGGLTMKDVALARDISAAARDLGVSPRKA
jgi:4a-hydroxytetrahydrobiopterin dehydratase